MPRRFALLLPLVLALLAPAAPCAAQDAPPETAEPGAPAGPVNLRPKYRPGQASRYEVWTLRDQTTTMIANGQSQSVGTRMEVRGQVTWRVEKVNPDGSATCAMTADWMTVELTAPDGAKQLVDSRKGSGEPEPVHRLLRAMTGVPVRIEMSADGTPTKASGVDAIRQRAGEGVRVPDELDFVESAADLATVPGGPASAILNAAWDAAFQWNHELGKLDTAYRFTLASVEEVAGIPIATVTGVATLKLLPDPAKVPNVPGGPRAEVRLLSGSAGTQVMFDLQRGEAVGRNTFQKTRIEGRLSFQGQNATQTHDESIQGQALRIAEE